MRLPAFVRSFVCLSVCLLAKLLKNACMDLYEMLRVDRCRDIDELINLGARFGCRNRIAFSDIVCAARRNFITSGKSHLIAIGRPSLQRRVVLKWFCSPRAMGTTLSEIYARHRVPF